MPFIAINRLNQFDTLNPRTFATEEEANAAARELLSASPNAQIYTAKLLSNFTATVSVQSAPVPEDTQKAEADVAGSQWTSASDGTASEGQAPAVADSADLGKAPSA